MMDDGFGCQHEPYDLPAGFPAGFSFLFALIFCKY